MAKITFFLIESAVADRHVESGHPNRNGDLDMKLISMTAIASVIALSVIVFGATGAAKAAPSFPRDMTVLNMPKAERIVASRAMRSVRRPLRVSPPTAMHLQFAMTSIGDGNAEPSADSRLPIPDSLRLTAGRRRQFMRHRRDWAAPFAFACQDK
jgi:hypothetical protein